MSVNFGWWNKRPEVGKFQVKVEVHGGNIKWTMHQGHHTPWQPYSPDDEDRERLMYEADKRVPRRLITQKQYDEIKRLSLNEGPGYRAGGKSDRPGPTNDD
tara:strand:- start:32 stop:334 length:303 start_codon:yes stop_codon:yes gene_type:complete